ncbi:phosphate-starvation-inducible PsiE family protein [Methylocapsa palsarum]|uniref:Uncharacterized membrane protein, DUF373 family n=1 Tax=Methylocapsa palsarum TaxID=1612308 RepID=A0A1I3VWQ4_9HYPH|nr:phosphate-starvation-inducible PsiE family protein [Methylocapsa palsarum]SFJ99665.1 Uncharacterized membrane protein, DUF373 family [Methylocapsa palsarum]
MDEDNNGGAHGALESDDPVVKWSYLTIRHAVRVLAILMVLVIWWGVAEVVIILYNRVMSHPNFLLEIGDIFATFGAFMAVLIAIEIFMNIVSYLRSEVMQLEIVVVTAYMAILRKIIILDYKEVGADYVYATAAVTLAVGVGYWLCLWNRRVG